MFFGGHSFEDEITLQLEMDARRESIPEAERCTECGGQGRCVIGCAFTHALTTTCSSCGGSGRRGDQLSNEEFRNKLRDGK